MPRSLKILTAGGFLSFFVFGFVDNLKGPLLPEILRSGDFSYGQGGTILLAGCVGFIIASLVTGRLVDVVGNRQVLLQGGICLSIGCVGFGSVSAYGLMILMMGVIGLGLGAIELGGNGLMVELHSENRGRYFNLLATFHGLGSLIVPLCAALLLSLDVHWQTIYRLCAVIAAPMILIFLLATRWENPRAGDRHTPQDQTHRPPPWDWRTVLRTAFTRQMCTYYILISAYVASELGVAAWMVQFLQQERARSVAVSTLFLSSFFGLLVLGRVAGALYVESFGYVRAIAVALVGSSLCLTAGIFGEGPFVYLLPVSGLFMSIVFPTLAAVVSKLHPANLGISLGILFAFAGLGGALGPWAVGVVSDIAGLGIGIGMSVAFSVIALVALGALRRHL